MAKSSKTDLSLQGLKLRDLRKPHHFTTDNIFFDHGWAAKLKPYAAILYECLCRHANLQSSEAFPSYQRLADLTGMSRRQSIHGIKLLLDFHLIAVKTKRKGKANVCCLLDYTEWEIPKDWEPRKPRSDKGKPNPKRKPGSESHSLADFSSGSESHSPDLVNEIHPKETKKKETKYVSQKKLWTQILSQLETRINRPSFNTWLRPIHLVSLQNSTCEIGVPDDVFVYWLQNHYQDLLQQTLTEVLGTPMNVTFVVEPEERT